MIGNRDKKISGGHNLPRPPGGTAGYTLKMLGCHFV